MKTAAEHWNAVYETRAAPQMSWFQATADMSLALIREGRVGMAKAILDVGAGASTFGRWASSRGPPRRHAP
jgi:hypothetical protein